MKKQDRCKMTEQDYEAVIPVTIGEQSYSPDDACEEGLRLLEAGFAARAEEIFRGILAVHPSHAGSLHPLGFIAYRAGNLEQAVDMIRAAVLLQPGAANFHNTLGLALRDLGRLDESVTHLRTALSLRPDSPEINNNLGNALLDSGLSEEALERFRTALRLKPESPEIHYNLANTLHNQGCPQEAEAHYRKALSLRPDFADAHYNLGNTLAALCRPREAKESYLAALQFRPDHPQARNNLGNLYHELNRPEAAEACYRESLRRQPDSAETYYNLACTLLVQNKMDEAAECCRKALTLKPGYSAARLALCMAQLPILYADEQEIITRRFAYEDCLRQLAHEIEHRRTTSDLSGEIGASQPFYLAYQGYDDRELKSLYGSLVCRIMPDKHASSLPKLPTSGQKIRVGIVCGFFEQHTVWRLFINGWLSQLDRQHFEVYGYHTGISRDAVTETAVRLCDRFIQGRLPINRWREKILADGPHVLLYPEIGMDPTAAILAAQRLAPVQCTTWGHPETTGFPTVDYFLSSELMEPPDGQKHYSERLILLPNLSTYFEPADWRPKQLRRSEIGLRSASTVFWSGQALYKYLPRFDSVFALIARQVGDCQFVFIEYAKSRNVTDLFKRRLHRAFSMLGLSADDYCVILPKLEPDEFIASVGISDVVLDTIGWSGGLSTLDCLSHDIPFVTMAGPLMRSRHTAGILKAIDAADTLCDTVYDYVSTAARLARDTAWRMEIGKKIRENKHRLFRDRTAISALEEFLKQVARRPSTM